MGLKDDIKKAFVEPMGDVEFNDTQEYALEKTSEMLAKAVIDFIQKQTFTITQMKASVELEDLKTTGPLNVKVDSQAPSGVPIVNGFGPGSTTAPVVSMGFTTEPLLMSNNGAKHGGRMSGKGYAFIGKNRPPDQETVQGPNDDNENTMVKLLEIAKGSE